MSSMIETPQVRAALDWAGAGIPVFPCRANGKLPATENGFYGATCNVDRILAWWAENPFYNPACCPNDAGLAVIDLDPGCVRPNVPATYEVRTPRGGAHLYYEGSLPCSVGKLGDNVDTRGIGGYVLLPGSVVDDKPYVVVNDVDPVELPQWVAEAVEKANIAAAAAYAHLDEPGNVARARVLVQGLVERGDVPIVGKRNNRTYQLACELQNLGLSPDTIRNLILELWNPHGRPPLDPFEVHDVVEHACRYSQNEAGAWATAPAEGIFRDALDKLPKEPQPAPNQLKSKFYAEDEDEQEMSPDPRWIIPNLLPDLATVLMVGASGSYKSFLALDLALGIAAGVETFGAVPGATGLVFYGALEGRHNIKKVRRKAWKLARGVDKIPNFYVMPGPVIALGNQAQEFGNEIKQRAAGRPIRLIVIDTLAKSMMGFNENDASDASKFVHFCDQLVETFKCSVLVLHHSGKDADRGARGSSAFVAGFDTIVDVRSHKSTRAVAVKVLQHKDADEPDEPWTFEGKELGNSLVFFRTTLEDYKLQTQADDMFDRKRIGQTLSDLDAFGLANAVTTTVLATTLTPANPTETMEEHHARINRTARALLSLSKTKLEAYTTRTARDVLWHLLTPSQEVPEGLPAHITDSIPSAPGATISRA